MTNEELDALAERELRIAQEETERTGSPLARFLVFSPEGTDIIAVDGRIMNSGQAKTELFRSVREAVKLKRAEAVIFVSDIWAGKSVDPEKYRLVQRFEEEFGIALNVEQMHELGIVEKREAIMVAIHTPLKITHITQFYKRFPQEKRIEWQEQDRMDDTVGRFGGKAMFFEEAQKA